VSHTPSGESGEESRVLGKKGGNRCALQKRAKSGGGITGTVRGGGDLALLGLLDRRSPHSKKRDSASGINRIGLQGQA